jgi:alkanesulfonate monooxygenase SsuD/methylene tetrahydromethanopterin reductase-like flavin-dependent oxidoreductase (luciferase family)
VWSLPEVPPLLFAAAVSTETAREVAPWADGVITIDQPVDALREFMDAYRDAGGRGPIAVQVHLSWAPTDEEALAIAHEQWRQSLVPANVSWELDRPQDFDERTTHVSPEQVAETLLCSSDPARHLDHLESLVAAGVERIYLHHVGTEQDAFIDTFGEQVLPRLKEASR